MAKRSMKKNQFRKVSKKLGVVTLASAMLLAPSFNLNVLAATSSTVALGSLTSTGTYTNLMNAEDSSFKGAIFASPNGAAGNAGTSASPLDLATALQKVADGKAPTVLLQAGTYKINKQITITASGKDSAYNVLKACKGANVVLDFSAETYNTADTSGNDRGIQLEGNYWYIGGITIKGAADNGMLLAGSHNIIERCIFDGNRDTGLQISRSSSSVTKFSEWPSYNYIVNTTSKNNADPATYENADGFAAKLTAGEGNVFDGCISHNNSDDGWDLFAKPETGSIGVVTIRNSVAMRNGKTENGTTKPSCDGNGFKLGGSGIPTAHIVQNSIAIQNLHHGFTDNNNPAALKISNVTAFDNNQGGGKENFSLYRCKDASLSNAISYSTNGTSDKLVNLSADHVIFNNSSKWYKVTDKLALDTTSSSGRGTAIQTGTTAADFVNATVPTVGTDFDKVWRNADGTINTNGVGVVSPSSQYGTAASDGAGLGVRLSATNKISTIKVSAAVSADSTSSNPATGSNPTTGSNPATGTNPATGANPATGTTPTTGSGTTTGSDTGKQESVEHNFTKSGIDDAFFTIKGSISWIKGIVSYNNSSLWKCLKMESSTSVDFTTTSESTLTLVFNKSFNGNVLIDGDEYQAKDGIVTARLNAKEHTITKGDKANLYYIGLAY